MNVRFFSGTRQQYDSLPTPRNPLGLYFCSDTHELFWADRLLTDGMRVVATYADLPDPTKAADGVVYYVNDTRNGYVVPHGTNKWLQTIYAPVQDVTKVPESDIYNTVTTVGAVRDIAAEIYGEIEELDARIADIEVGTSSSGVTAIYFAGYKLDARNDGTYYIDQLCALRALGFDVPENSENIKIDIITKEYVNEQLEATKSEIEALIPEIDELATKDELRVAIEGIKHPTVDLAGYATKDDIKDFATTTYVDGKLSEIEIPEIPTKVSELENDSGYLTQHQDLSNYAKKSDIPSVEGLASEDFVRSEIAKAELNGGEVTEDELANLLANYYNKSETETLVNEAVNRIYIPDTSNFITIEDVEAKGYLTDHQDLGHLATKEELQDAISNIEYPSVDLSGYATVESVEDLAASVESDHAQLERVTYYTESIRKEVASLGAAAITQKYEVLPIEGMLIQYRDSEIRLNTQRVIPVKQTVGSTGNPNMFYATFRAYAPEGATGVIESDGSQTDSEPTALATDAYGRKYATIWSAIANTSDGITWSKWGDKSTLDKYLGFYYTFKWFKEDVLIGTDKVRVILTNDSCHDDLVPDAVARRIDDKINNIEVPSIEGLVTKPELEEAISSIEIPTVDLSGYATETFVRNAIAEAELDGKEVDLTGYATKDDIKELASSSYVDEKFASIKIPDVSKFITEIPDEYITASELAAEGFIKEHQSLAEYAKSNTVVKHKYEVLPVEGMLVSYDGNEVRINTQHVDIANLPPQTAGDGSSDKYYYATFRAYAPEGATSVIEGQSDKMDSEHSSLATDSYGRKFTTIWAAIANKSGDAWSKFGDKSTADKYLGFYYNFHWYKDDTIISMDKVRVILTNDTCHNDLVPDAVARRIDDKINAIKIPDVDLSGYATEQFVADEICKITIPDVSNFITMSDVEAKGYLTEHQSLEAYAKKDDLFSKSYNDLTDKPEIPSVEGFATEYYVNNKVAEIAIPNVSGFITESAVSSLLEAKADSILFTDDMRVGTPIGNFVADESLLNMTLKDIVTKLLGLSAYVPAPDMPSGTSEVVQALITNKLAPYMLSEDGAPVVAEYKYKVMTPDEAKEDNQEESFLYQVIEDGVVKESGYQIATVYQENDYLTVLIPNTITDFTVVDYSAIDGNWTASSWTLEENSNYHIDGYKAYTVPEEFCVLSGIAIRIIIHN